MRLGKGWRKREGIEPPGDIAASRPDLKSGGATSAPSASVSAFRLAPDRGRDYLLFGASFARNFLDFFFFCRRRRISRFRSVVILTPRLPDGFAGTL